MAIQRTLARHPPSGGGGDFKSALQVLQQSQPPEDNVGLTPAILGYLQGLVGQELHVRLNWIPCHVGLTGNEVADEAAR